MLKVLHDPRRLLLSGQAYGLQGLVLHQNFECIINGVSYDRSPFHNNGVVYGAVSVKGKIGDALSFDGVDDYVAVPDSPTWKPENLTVMLWLYPKGWVDQVTGNASHHIYPSGDGFGITTKTSYWEWWIKDSTGRRVRNLSHANRLNEWHHLVLTYDKTFGDMKFYWNGELKDTYNLGTETSIAWGSGALTIGHGPNYATYGIIDEVRIYNQALSQAEIKRLMFLEVL